MSETPEYVGVHRVLRSQARERKRLVLVPILAAAVAFLGFGSTAFTTPTHAPAEDTSKTPSLCDDACFRALAESRASRSDPRTPPPVTPTPPVKKPKPKPSWANPLPGHKSYCNYWQWRGTYNHRGEDIPAPWGTPIHAVHAGSVKTQWDGGGGNMTIISHDGMAEVYMHQSSYKVTSGHVVVGQVIGYIGETGDAQGPHLHLEIQPNGPWNGVTSPDKWLADRGVYIGC